MVSGSLLPVCAYFDIHFTVMLAAGAYRSIERGHCASLQRKGYKINQHLVQGARNTGTLHKHSWICQFSELDLCVCLPPSLAGFALMAQCWLIPMSPVDITSDVITKPLQWGRLLNHCQRIFTHFYRWFARFPTIYMFPTGFFWLNIQQNRKY